MKTRNSIFAIVGIVLAVACAKNEKPFDAEEPNQPGNIVTLHAIVSEEDTKATVDGETGAYLWTAGTDVIAVHSSDGKYHVSEGASASTNDATFTVNLGEGVGDAFAVYPASIVTTTAANYGQDGHSLDVTLPGSYPLSAVQTDKTPLPMIAAYNVTQLSFSHLCALLRITVYNLPGSTNYLTLDFNGKKVHGDFSVAAPVAPGSVIAAAAAGVGEDIITITDLGISSWTNALTFNIPIPVGDAYTTVKITAYNDSDKVLLTMTRPLKTSANWTPARAKGRKIGAALPAFQVSAGSYVAIAPGNLQYYRASTSDSWDETGKFRFAANSWTINQSSYSENLSTNTVSDRFAWGTSGASWPEGLYGTYNKPYHNTYSGGTVNNKYGPVYDNAKGVNDLTGYFANGDWGVFNAIGSDPKGTWRLMSNSEFNHLKANNSGWAIGVINTGATNDKGLILLPKNFVNPTALTIVTGMRDNAKDDGLNHFTPAEWRILEAAGAAFLPFAGAIWDVPSSPGKTDGRYWLSTCGGSATNAYEISIVYDDNTSQHRCNASTCASSRAVKRSVRLVRPL